MYVIGTAGHVDHGKSALVQALTGIDPDRLREEKERGLTIDLGFAWLTLPSGLEVSIVDVPGHERFIKNMLAGVGGIDLALLVVAADEGVMPQTQEHLAIIDLLGIQHGVVAVTKTDLVEPEFVELVTADIREALAGTSIEAAEIVPCSSATGAGLDELLRVIEAELARIPPHRDTGRPRLPIDRVFTIAGFGTVATGTLVDGSLRTGQEVEIVPGGRRARIRGLQSHGKSREEALPGRRTAVNLAGVAVEELRRGMVVTTPGWLRPTDAVDVRLRAVRYLSRPIRHNLTVTFHSGAEEVEGRLLLLDREELRPGESGWAQIRLAAPAAVVRGDRFIIRDPNDTLGGGRVVDTHVRRHRRFHRPTIEALEALAEGSPEDLVRMAAERLQPADIPDLVRESGLGETEARRAIDALLASGELVAVPAAAAAGAPVVYTAEGLERLTARLRDVLAAFHRQHPLRRGVPREELRARLGLPQRAFEQTLALWVSRGTVRESAGAVASPEHEPAPTLAQAAAASEYLAALRASPFSPPTDVRVDDDVLAYLEDQGSVVRTGDGVVFPREGYDEMVARVVAHLREHGTITLAQVRDMFGTSRKYAQSFLEHLDSQHITRRVGDERVLRRREG